MSPWPRLNGWSSERANTVREFGVGCRIRRIGSLGIRNPPIESTGYHVNAKLTTSPTPAPPNSLGSWQSAARVAGGLASDPRAAQVCSGCETDSLAQSTISAIFGSGTARVLDPDPCAPIIDRGIAGQELQADAVT
jgi:hypothetical protein